MKSFHRQRYTTGPAPGHHVLSSLATCWRCSSTTCGVHSPRVCSVATLTTGVRLERSPSLDLSFCPQVPNPSSAAMTDHDPAPPTVGAPEGPVPETPPVPPPFSEQQLAWLQGYFAPPGTPTHPPPAGAGERIARAGVFYWHADPNVACVLVTSTGSGGTPSPRDVPPQRAGCA